MTRILPALAALFVACHAGLAGEAVLAFQRDANIYVTTLAGTKPRKLVAGDWPDVSPDGTRVAYNTQNGDTPERHLAVADIATRKQAVLQGIPSDNCHSPVWSPDGTKLVFQIFAGGEWHLGLVDADGKNFRYLRKTKTGQPSYWDASWAPGGRSLFCQDMTSILRIGLDGKVRQKWVLADLVADQGTFNSGSHLALSADGKTLLFDVDMNEEVTRKDWDGPPPAIWKLDLSSGRAARVTPRGVYAWHPCWISANEFLCTTPAKNSAETLMIQRWNLADGKSSPVVINASAPSVSTPTP